MDWEICMHLVITYKCKYIHIRNFCVWSNGYHSCLHIAPHEEWPFLFHKQGKSQKVQNLCNSRKYVLALSKTLHFWGYPAYGCFYRSMRFTGWQVYIILELQNQIFINHLYLGIIIWNEFSDFNSVLLLIFFTILFIIILWFHHKRQQHMNIVTLTIEGFSLVERFTGRKWIFGILRWIDDTSTNLIILIRTWSW